MTYSDFLFMIAVLLGPYIVCWIVVVGTEYGSTEGRHDETWGSARLIDLSLTLICVGTRSGVI